MKKRSLPALAIAVIMLLSLSCKKNNDPNYYFKVKIDGQWTTYTAGQAELGPDQLDPSLTDLVVVMGDMSGDNTISVSIQKSGDIGVGSYQTGTNPFADVYFLKMNTSNGLDAYGLLSSGSGPDPVYTINITSITDKAISGTITGNYLYDYSNDVQLNLTEGEFVARRVD